MSKMCRLSALKNPSKMPPSLHVVVCRKKKRRKRRKRKEKMKRTKRGKGERGG